MKQSPIMLLDGLISPLKCEEMVTSMNNNYPNMDQNGNPTVSFKGSRLSELRITQVLDSIMPSIDSFFNTTIKTTTPMLFEWYPEKFTGHGASCESYDFVRHSRRTQSGSWHKVKDYDFTAVLFLSSANESIDIDPRYEFRGGKFSFPAFKFGVHPQAGTMMIFPSRPNFANGVEPIDFGDLNLVRFNLVAEQEFNFVLGDYPSNYTEWFN